MRNDSDAGVGDVVARGLVGCRMLLMIVIMAIALTGNDVGCCCWMWLTREADNRRGQPKKAGLVAFWLLEIQECTEVHGCV